MAKRTFQVDLCRIIATFFVILLHVLGQGGILRNLSPTEITYWGAWFLEISAYCAVNCFALISGYIMLNKTIKLQKIIELWLHVLFYSLLFTALAFAFIPETRTLRNLVIAFFPVTGNQWWYVSSYFVLFFAIPFLNAAVHHIPKKTFEMVLTVILIGVCIIDCIIPIDAFAFKSGYSAIWLIVLYIFGAYINKYDLKEKITAAKSILGFFAMIILSFTSKIVIQTITKSFWGKIRYDDVFISYTSITIVFAAIFMLLFCLNIHINKPFHSIIYLLAPTTFGVYLIHVNPYIFQYIVKDAFVPFANKSLIIMIMCVLVAAFAIFLVCAIIELLRIQLFKLIRVNQTSKMIDNKITALCLKIWKE